jgi:hypothetical protein
MCKNLHSTFMCNWTQTPYVGVFSKFVYMLKSLMATASVLKSVSKKERQGITGTLLILALRVICS